MKTNILKLITDKTSAMYRIEGINDAQLGFVYLLIDGRTGGVVARHSKKYELVKLKRYARHTFAELLVADMKSQRRFDRMFNTFAVYGYAAGFITWLLTRLIFQLW